MESHSRVLSLSSPGLQHPTFNDNDFEQIALAAFLEDYCISSRNKALSRGYLDSLGSMLAHGKPSSDLAKAAKIASLASLGNKLGEPGLVHQAKLSYLELLVSFQTTISKPATANTIESLATAVLLGLYEIISATENHPGEHSAHFRGVAAILSSEGSLFNQYLATQIVPGKESAMLESPSKGILMWPHDLGILCPPNAASTFQGLDDLLLRFSPIFRKGQLIDADISLPLNEVLEFRECVMTVDKEFAKWPARQAQGWMPKTIGTVADLGALQDMTSAPSRIDTYLDVYVSAVWNSYRKCRLLLLNYIYTCSQRLQDNDPDDTSFFPSQFHILKEAQELSESIAASIPFHLTRNPENFLVHRDQKSSTMRADPIPNKSIGGLLIMYVIYAVSKLPIVPKHLREMFTEYLAWMGRAMGIGQAALLADPSSSFPKEFLVDGHVLVWAGTLILQQEGEEEIAMLRWGVT